MDALFDPIFGADAVAAELDGAAWVRAMLDAEAALARACAIVGLVERSDAEAVTRMCGSIQVDPAQIGRRAVTDGNPVIPLVRELRTKLTTVAGAGAARAVHHGATSQDILDTAAMLVSRRALDVILRDAAAATAAAAELAGTHRDTPMAARTLMRQALPTTFGAMAAVWVAGLSRAATTLGGLRADRLAVQLGGAAGTLSAYHPRGPGVRGAFARELGLPDPGTVWHTERTRIAELAGAAGSLCGAAAKAATDVILLSQNEVGEVREAAAGGSSSMPHKRNPIAAITARAAAMRAPGLVATLFAAMPAEYQRGAGPWHAEWKPLVDLLTATGGAVARLRVSLCGLSVDTQRMRTNLERLSDPPWDVGHAPELADTTTERWEDR